MIIPSLLFMQDIVARNPVRMIIIARIKTVRYFLRESPDTITVCLEFIRIRKPLLPGM
jgi:hypothetical protein